MQPPAVLSLTDLVDYNPNFSFECFKLSNYVQYRDQLSPEEYAKATQKEKDLYDLLHEKLQAIEIKRKGFI